RDYLELIAKLPNGIASTLEEVVLGVEMLSAWASSSNHFLQVIGHRFYGQAWRILRDKYSHVDTNFGIEQKILTHTIQHHRLIAEGTNARLLRHAVKASPAIAALLLHHRLALPEGSPRDLAVVDALHQVLTALHMGAEMLPNPALRNTYLEAWHDSLQVIHATGNLAAREVLAGIRMLRLDLVAPDPEQRALARFHFPLFWRLFRIVSQTNPVQGQDFGMVDEITFLQQNRDLKRTPPQILEPVLQAFPHYVDSQIAHHRHHPLQLSFVLDAFLGLAGQFRGAFLLAKDPVVRERFVNTYVEVLRSCRQASLELPTRQKSFPRNIPGMVTAEMGEGLAELRNRWTEEQGEFQIRSLDQYWRLAETYPVAQGLADQLHSGPYLKPLSRLAGFNGNDELRQAAEDLLRNLLNRFRTDALHH
ncbi:MAG TPA: hypothetical protein VJP40_02700, partial [bacterium]|nr:hypothetical protein [bacterium]